MQQNEAIFAKAKIASFCPGRPQTDRKKIQTVPRKNKTAAR
jgi:hypothetical protein